MTGPAIVNIFAPTPRMKPSVLNSMAGAETALEKPVIGTSVPAPANFAMSSYTLKPVNNAAKVTKVMDVAQDASIFSISKAKNPFMMNCPKVQIKPPTQKALRQSFQMGDFGARDCAIFSNSFSVMQIPPKTVCPNPNFLFTECYNL